MPQFDSLGDRIKTYERMGNVERLMPGLPVIVRLDGKSFHNYTRSLEKPFCRPLMRCMQECTYSLMQETGAVCGYTQSDEITLVLWQPDWKSQLYFDGKVAKINSVLASMCSVRFNYVSESLSDCFIRDKNHGRFAYFDCRCFNVPSLEEGVNVLVWREQDAVRNSIQMLGQHYFSHSKLQGKSCDEIQEMLFQEHQINWNDLEVEKKRGTYFLKKVKRTPVSEEELEKLPAKHAARNNPNLMVDRQVIERAELPILTKIVNRVEVIFQGREPQVESDNSHKSAPDTQEY
jgi:tRNA(His) guanylyltransferase